MPNSNMMSFVNSLLPSPLFLMGTPIHLTLEELGDYLHLASEGSFDENRHFDPSLFIQSGSASKLNLHDHVLHLILTWNLRPIKKHVKL
ncbi:hypothetical protein Gotur_032739, partial [Gossypium turneri]